MAKNNDMPVTALAPWYGSKRTLAPAIVRALGPHTAYWEPFAGGFSVIMTKPLARMETLNDLHGDITHMANVIKHPTMGPAFYRAVRRLVFSDDALAVAKAACRVPLPEGVALNLDRAVAFFAASWMGRNGEAGIQVSQTRKPALAVRWTLNGGDPATRFRSAVASIPAWRRRLRHVTVLRRDALKGVIDQIPDVAGGAVYVDPPYLAKDCQYVHDFDPEKDEHAILAQKLQRFIKTRVVVSYYDDARLAGLYPAPKWTITRFQVTKAMSATSKRGTSNTSKAVEVLITNGPANPEQPT